MRNGIYEVKFTTNVGTLGLAAIVVKHHSLVGADGLQFYRGSFEQTGRKLSLVMEVVRHNFAVDSAFGSESLFTLQWEGEASSDTDFRATCRPPDKDLTIYAVGRLIQESE